MAVAPGSGGEDQQGLILVEVVQHLAVHLEHAQLGGPDAFLVAARDCYLVLAPKLGELGTDVKQPLGEGGGAAPGAGGGDERPQVGSEGPAVHVVVIARVDLASVGPGEPAVDQAAVG